MRHRAEVERAAVKEIWHHFVTWQTGLLGIRFEAKNPGPAKKPPSWSADKIRERVRRSRKRKKDRLKVQKHRAAMKPAARAAAHKQAKSRMQASRARQSHAEAAKDRQQRAAYHKSPPGRARHARYKQSPKGKESHARFEKSPAGKESHARFEKSPAGKASHARFENSPAGKASRSLFDRTHAADRRVGQLTRRAQPCGRYLVEGRTPCEHCGAPLWPEEQRLDRKRAAGDADSGDEQSVDTTGALKRRR
eukprot:gene4193-507_t